MVNLSQISVGDTVTKASHLKGASRSSMTVDVHAVGIVQEIVSNMGSAKTLKVAWLDGDGSSCQKITVETTQTVRKL